MIIYSIYVIGKNKISYLCVTLKHLNDALMIEKWILILNGEEFYCSGNTATSFQRLVLILVLDIYITSKKQLFHTYVSEIVV